jgi:hypothetical protein
MLKQEETMASKMFRDLATHRKRGDDRNEPAKKHRKSVRNFSQSRDIREDRGTRQSKRRAG